MQPGSFAPQMISPRTTARGTARPSQPGRKCAHGRPVPPIRLAARPGPRPDCARGSRPKSEGGPAVPGPGRPAGPRHSTRPPGVGAKRWTSAPLEPPPSGSRARHRLWNRTAPQGPGRAPGSSFAPCSRPPTGLRGRKRRRHRKRTRRRDAGGGRSPRALRRLDLPARPPRLRRETVVCRRPALRDRPRGDETTGSDETHGGEGRPGSDGRDRTARAVASERDAGVPAWSGEPDGADREGEQRE